MMKASQIRYIRKALVAGGVALAGAVGVAATDGSVTGVEWVVVAATTVVAAGGVYQVRNGPKPPPAPAPLNQ